MLGTLDGAEVDLDSVEGHIEGERSGETLFLNPLDHKKRRAIEDLIMKDLGVKF